ncbi:integrase/recombinase XerD [Labedella gwakjiensis]|uniref:Tyrosine recombinase XerD n=1 Tax=Labedella gwakjiensis TaxID=390269 RepID=A0A2P8GWW7_9MICO|nr:site-specific tyrosine recombinase XerD [Labedella gwakjiensis]PSL38458.1 integrase/recombinase XerD [Labedella gwakjiensis]RUQ87021.1 site-specific tyrosine recombinase XerD [Labedella gwakjiensis]
MTLARAVDEYVRHVQIERGLSANTIAAYRRDLSAYVDWLTSEGVEGAGDILPAHVTGFSRALATREEKPLGASSIARTLSSVRGFHRFLLEEREVDGDVSRDVRPPKLGRRLPKALTISQIEALLGATEGEDVASLRDHALLELLYATGARVSEAVGLNVDDVVEPDIVRLTGKGDKQRIVPLGRYARAAIDAYLVRGRPTLSAVGPSTPALFLGMRGARMSRQSAWLVIRAAAERAGLTEEVSPHTLRHSFATHLLQGGADVRVVQELLGHSSVATTQIYTLVTADSLRDVYTTAHPRAR